jgi:hypothetical protein
MDNPIILLANWQCYSAFKAIKYSGSASCIRQITKPETV